MASDTTDPHDMRKAEGDRTAKQPKPDRRAERLAAQLRANLQRRKAQSRARASQAADEPSNDHSASDVPKPPAKA